MIKNTFYDILDYFSRWLGLNISTNCLKGKNPLGSSSPSRCAFNGSTIQKVKFPWARSKYRHTPTPVSQDKRVLSPRKGLKGGNDSVFGDYTTLMGF